MAERFVAHRQPPNAEAPDTDPADEATPVRQDSTFTG
jgi:hypothetical protein